jgi:hypothetical protein
VNVFFIHHLHIFFNVFYRPKPLYVLGDFPCLLNEYSAFDLDGGALDSFLGFFFFFQFLSGISPIDLLARAVNNM